MFALRTEDRQAVQRLILELGVYESNCCHLSHAIEDNTRLNERVILDEGCCCESHLFIVQKPSWFCRGGEDNRAARSAFQLIVVTVNNKMRGLGVLERSLPASPAISEEPLTIGNIRRIRIQFENLLEQARQMHLEEARRAFQGSPPLSPRSPQYLSLPGTIEEMT